MIGRRACARVHPNGIHEFKIAFSIAGSTEKRNAQNEINNGTHSFTDRNVLNSECTMIPFA